MTPERDVLIPLVAHGLQTVYGASPAESAELAESALHFWQMAGLIDEQQWEGWWLCAFRHLTFQEYGIARLLHTLWQRDRKLTWRFLKSRLHKAAWREPILLLVSMMDDETATAFIKRLLKARSRYENILHRDLRLAAACIGENRDVDANLPRQVTKRLIWYARDHRFMYVWDRIPRVQSLLFVLLRTVGLVHTNPGTIHDCAKFDVQRDHRTPVSSLGRFGQ